MGTRPRGLCWPCFENEDVRRSVTLQCNRGITTGHGRLPAEPTQARPGSPEKMRVLEQRAERGEALFHPLDATADVYRTLEEVAMILARDQEISFEDEE
jgi:hypothetical protein